MIARLTDPWFDAEFIGDVAPDGLSYSHQGGLIAGAQGLFLWSPCGYADPQYRVASGGRPHGVLIVFENPIGAPVTPSNFGPHSRGNPGVHPRWKVVSGTGLNDLTLSPSVDLTDPKPTDPEKLKRWHPCWHGWIQNGEVR